MILDAGVEEVHRLRHELHDAALIVAQQLEPRAEPSRFEASSSTRMVDSTARSTTSVLELIDAALLTERRHQRARRRQRRRPSLSAATVSADTA